MNAERPGGQLEPIVGRQIRELAAEMRRKRRQARAARDLALNLMERKGCEWHANEMSKAAARLDAEVADLRARALLLLPLNAAFSGPRQTNDQESDGVPRGSAETHS